MKTKKLWIFAAITAIIIVILFFATYKTDEERLIGKWNWFDTSGEIGFSITCEKDHTGEVYRYGKTNSMEWHIDDGFFYMYERNQYGQVTEYKFTYKQDGVVLLLENEEGELRLYLDGKPRNAVEGVEQLNIGTVVAGTEGLFVNGHMDKKHSAYVLKEGYDLEEIKGNYIIAKYNDAYSLFSLSGERELESSYSFLSFVEPSESKKVLLYYMPEGINLENYSEIIKGVMDAEGNVLIDSKYKSIQVMREKYFFCYGKDGDEYGVDVFDLNGEYISHLNVDTKRNRSHGRYEEVCEDLYAVQIYEDGQNYSTAIVDINGNIIFYDNVDIFEPYNDTCYKDHYYYRTLTDHGWYLYKMNRSGALVSMYKGYYYILGWTNNGFAGIYDEHNHVTQLKNIDTGETWGDKNGNTVFERVSIYDDCILIEATKDSGILDIYDKSLNYIKSVENYDSDYFPYLVTKDADGYSLIDYRSGKTIVNGMASINELWRKYEGHVLIIDDQDNKIMVYDLIQGKFLIDQGITVNNDRKSWTIYDDELVFDDVDSDPYELAILDEGAIVLRDRESRVYIYQGLS